MRIFNEDKTQEITDYDKEKYYEKEDKLFIAHHDYSPEVQKKSHYNVIASYDGGGKDVEEIIDVPYQPAIEAYDEYEDILVIVPYTKEQLDDIKYNKLVNWFEKDYRTYAEMFTRRQALNIEDKIVDSFRNKTYHNLIELYEEAEKVAKEIKELGRN